MQKNSGYVKRKFEEYYRENSEVVQPPPEMEKREYGFLLFEGSVMVRHKAFKNATDLRTFIRTKVPAHAYNSTAYYLQPEEEMENKKWQGADLTFDVDADHIPTQCKYMHDLWNCESCNTQGKGPPPAKCPKCNGERIGEETWLCEVCLERAKEEVIKLLDFLVEDFGFPRRDITVCFSGHRGYHVHVRADEAKGLDSNERKEIVDYVLGLGFVPELHPDLLGAEEGSTRLSVPGWTKRAARGLYEILNEVSERELTNWNINRKVANIIAANREELASGWIGEKTWRLPQGVGQRTWKVLVQKAVEREAVRVDTVVTTDIHRLIRIPETLNGKTGFRASEVNSIESFDPFKDAIAFKGEETVYVREAPQFRVGDETLGPYVDKTVTLPSAAAVLLVCKGKASLKAD